MHLSELHAAARELAEGGVPVFPCLPLSKVPACAQGFHDATTNLHQIDKWWSDNADYNPAFCPHMVGLGVVDIDGEEGEQAWLAFQAEHGAAPETRVVRTPRDGRHLYYLGVLPASQSKLGQHVDTRGVGSYVLAPPSRVRYPDGREGTYRVEVDRSPADLPASLPDFLKGLQRAAAKASVDDLDLAPNLARAERLLKDYVALGHVAVEGQMGDGRTFAVACEVMNLGVSQENAYNLLTEHWNPHCIPPWDEDELRVKVENASRYAQNEAGSWAVEPPSEVFAGALDKLAANSPAAPQNPRFRLWTLEEMGARPVPEFLIPEMFPAEGLSMVYGPKSSYKSFLVMERGLELAALGTPVVYVAGEGGRGIELRAKAWRMLHEITGPIPFYIVDNAPWASDPGMVIEFMENVKAAGVRPAMVVIDTVARATVGLNENDAKDMGIFVAAMDTIRRSLRCAVVVIHHTGKDAGRGARGSGALEAATDAAFEVKAEKNTRTVAMWCRRQKDAAEREEPWTYEGKDFGDSLVFQPISQAEYRNLTRTEDQMAAKAIGKLLRELGAVGVEHAVSSYVLAHELNKDAEASEEGMKTLISRTIRILAKKAKGALEPYCYGEGSSLVWCVV